MVLENFCYYNIFEEGHTTPDDEVAYRIMQQSSSAVKYTPSGEIYYDTVYSSRLPYTTVRTHDEYVAYNNIIKDDKILNNKKETIMNRVLFFIKDIFCCR